MSCYYPKVKQSRNKLMFKKLIKTVLIIEVELIFEQDSLIYFHIFMSGHTH